MPMYLFYPTQFLEWKNLFFLFQEYLFLILFFPLSREHRFFHGFQFHLQMKFEHQYQLLLIPVHLFYPSLFL
uniref:Uncharacterized protein n=1 Tax=Lepeophtheirus salmonis TaxID=72036 RepID=A0A0K2U7A1_LEPSM